VWNEDFFFSPLPDSQGALVLKVKDEDMGTSNETMGEVTIKLADVRAAKTITKKAYEIIDKKGIPVKGKSGKNSTLTLDLKWT
jgi:Ca2+-dependent lipid-binding protein